MSENIAIKIENLSKSYKLYKSPRDRLKEALHPFKRKYHQDFYALHNINFEIRKGETLGIVGKNGAGKSTLLKLITGILNPTMGNIYIHGRVSALLELGAGFNVELSGMENIYFQANILGISKKEITTKIEGILAFADIGDFIYQKVKTYSSGMFARLAFAVAIHVEPDILIVDEALAVGDANFQLKCHKRMDELREKGVTILFVSHDTYSVKTLCQRALFIDKGTQIMYGSALDVVNEYLLFLDKDHTYPLIEQTSACTLNNAPANILKVRTFGSIVSENGCINIKTKDKLEIEVDYQINSNELQEIVLVFNLYRERDNVYVCGATTLMDGLSPISVKLGENSFKLILPSLPLLSGKYRLRVAINEKKGLGIITELNDAMFINIVDNHEAEGLVTLPREWKIPKNHGSESIINL